MGTSNCKESYGAWLRELTACQTVSRLPERHSTVVAGNLIQQLGEVRREPQENPR